MTRFKEYMEDKFPKEFTEEQIRDLFDRLDSSHDGLLDVNELGATTFFRYKDSIRPERQFWDGISKVPWIDSKELLKKFEDEPETREELNNAIKKMNIEYNPYLTFWQYLRSADSEPGRKFNEIIKAKEIAPFSPIIAEKEEGDHLNYHTPRAKVTIDSRSYSPSRTKQQTKPRVRVNPRPSTSKVKKQPLKNTGGKRKSTLKKTSRPKRPQNTDYFARNTNINLAPHFANFAPASPILNQSNFNSMRSPNSNNLGHRRTYTRQMNPMGANIDPLRGSVFTPIKTVGPFGDRSLSPFLAHPAANFHHQNLMNRTNRQQTRTPTYNPIDRNGYRTPPPKPRTRHQRQMKQNTAHQEPKYYQHRRNGSYNSTSRARRSTGRQVIKFDKGEKSLTITGNFSTIDMPKEKWVFDNTQQSASNLNGKPDTSFLAPSETFGTDYKSVPESSEMEMPDEKEVEVFY